jgi:hypothetical protein
MPTSKQQKTINKYQKLSPKLSINTQAQKTHKNSAQTFPKNKQQRMQAKRSLFFRSHKHTIPNQKQV